jgi:predicted nucleic-acid-binding protein
MISIDTNVLVRVLVNDAEETEQVNAARNAVSNAQEVFISQIVQVETIWVLSKGYKLKKQDLIALLKHLSENAAYHLEKEESFLQAITMYKDGRADFSDYLILADARERSLKVVTFDKRFARTKDTILVEV